MTEEREKLLFGNRNERLAQALQMSGKTKKDLDQEISILESWLKTQNHFPETPRDEILTNMIILNKFSTEKVKQQIDMYYSLRSVLPEFFANKNYKLPHMQVAYDNLSYVPLPKLTKEGYRISIIQLTRETADAYEPYDIFCCLGHYIEIRLMKDVMVGEILIVDTSISSLGHVSKVTPMTIKIIFAAAEKVYKNIVKQVHFVNVPGFVERIITVIKQIVSRKLAERIYAHKSSDALTKYIPQELLPIDFGGPEHTIKELRQLWRDEYDNNHQRLDELDHLLTNENKRPQPLINDDILGFHGSFKKLDLD